MKLAICNETYRDWPWEKAFEHAVQHGYRGLEVAPFTLGKPADQIPAQLRKRLRSQAEKAGLEIIGLHWLFASTTGYHLTSPDPNVQQATWGYLQHLADLCGDLGGHLMVLGSPQQRRRAPGVDSRQAVDIAAYTIERALPRLERHKIQLAIEPLGPGETNFINTAAEAIELCELIDSPFVRLHLDVKAMTTETDDIPGLIRQYQDWLVHFHANDPNLKGPGMGDVDIQPILQALADIYYDGWISVEVFDQEASVKSLVEESAANLRRAWESVGPQGNPAGG